MFNEKDIGPVDVFLIDELELSSCSSTLSKNAGIDCTLVSYNIYCLVYRKFLKQVDMEQFSISLETKKEHKL